MCHRWEWDNFYLFFCFVLETNHTQFYLENEDKQNLCHEQCLDAASNLEKQILDLAKSNIGYKSQIVNKRKEIENETKNYNIHESLKPRQENKLGKTSIDKQSFTMFRKASEMLQQETEAPNPAESTEPRHFEKPFEKREKTHSTLSGLKTLKKRKKEKSEALSTSEKNLLDKYLNKATIGINETKPEIEKKTEISNSDIPPDQARQSPTQNITKEVVELKIKPKIKLTNLVINSKRQDRLKRLKRIARNNN
jgi:hypothetical protein